jgi:CheY-like chemotaxis protein
VSGEISRLLADTRDGACRVKRIVHDFRVFARGGDGRPRLCDVREVLDATVKLTLNELRHRARLVRSYQPVPLVSADEARLCQLFLNLLVNALQSLPETADPEHAEIYVGTYTADDGSAVVEIADTGVGIPEHLMARVFEPFFSTKPAGLGTGLGLSICESIVNALGGRIDLHSQPPGGTRCRVTLPAAGVGDETHEEPAPRAPTVAGPRLRLLLVDDEERLLAALAQDLCREYEVEEAASGADAIRKLRERAFDAVVCDLMMPGISGAEVYEAARTHRPGLEQRFVFMTGGAFTGGTRHFFEQVTNPRLEKPFELSELHTVLRELLGSRRA